MKTTNGTKDFTCGTQAKVKEKLCVGQAALQASYDSGRLKRTPDLATLLDDPLSPEQRARIGKFVHGMQKSGMPLTFSEKGYENLARRFGVSVLELKVSIHHFRKSREEAVQQ